METPRDHLPHFWSRLPNVVQRTEIGRERDIMRRLLLLSCASLAAALPLTPGKSELSLDAAASAQVAQVVPDATGHVTIPSTWTSIVDDNLGNKNQITSVTIPSSITKIGSRAF